MININKFSMGATSAILTSLALIAGMAHGDSTRLNVIAGLLIIAIADNVADSLSIHIAKEAEGVSRKNVWISTVGNFISRLVLALTFTLIVWLLPSFPALVISVAWGTLMLIVLSYSIAKKQDTHPFREIFWHLLIAFIIIAGSKILGDFIAQSITA